MSDRPRRPRAFRVGAPDVVVDDGEADLASRLEARAVIVPATEAADVSETALPPTLSKRRDAPWRALFLSGAGGLVSLAVGLMVQDLIERLWARAEWLGWIGLACLGLALLAVVGVAVREVSGLRRLARIESLRERFDTAWTADDRRAAPRLVGDLERLYADRPELARARAALAAHAREVVDGRDLLSLAERELMTGLDATARAMILEAGKRVSVVTAISPRAVVDIAYVAFENLRLMRRLAELYGGRPGSLGFLRLVGHTLTHLGITGGMALGDTLVQQLVGQGLAARLSARLGEGVVNGLLTARLGLAALEIVRPTPFHALPRPSLGDMMGELTRPTASSEPPAPTRP